MTSEHHLLRAFIKGIKSLAILQKNIASRRKKCNVYDKMATCLDERNARGWYDCAE